MNLKKHGINTYQTWTLGTAVTLLIISFSLYFFMKKNESRLISHAVAQQTESAKNAIIEDIETRTERLEALAKQWEDRSGIPKEEWAKQTARHIEDMPGTLAIEWIDKKNTIRWITPLTNKNRLLLNHSLTYEKNRKDTLQEARNKKITTITAIIDLIEGGKGFLIYVPLFVNQQFDGFILGVYRATEIFTALLNRPLYANYNIKLLENKKVFYTKNANSPDATVPFSDPLTFNLYKTNWEISLQPSIRAISDVNIHPKLPFITLLVSLILSCLITTVLFFTGLLYSRNKTIHRKSKSLEHLAHSDYLTGLCNRANFDNHLNKAIAHCQRNQLNFALLYLDLDGFKSVNDLYGHSAGDEVLIQTAKRFKELLREYDLIARIGGDEFAMILYDISDHEKIKNAAERIIETIKKTYHTSNEEISIGISLGIACFPSAGKQMGTLKKHADEALYKAKSRGKNQWQFWGD